MNRSTSHIKDGTFKKIARKIVSEMKRLQVPGVAIGIWHKGRELAEGFGITSIEHPLPVTPDTLFQTGSISKTFTIPPLWALEMAQFTMSAYYILGGAYSLQLDAHVRMDLLYGRWSPRTKAAVDSATVLLLAFYLVFLLDGGYASTAYALYYDERSYSAWAPYMAPIKIIMCVGILLMLLQTTATFFRNVAEARGRPLDEGAPVPAAAGAEDVPGQATSPKVAGERPA